MLPMHRILPFTVIVAALSVAGCRQPDAAGLRQSFAQQLAANRFVRELQQHGDDLIFSGPGPEGTPALWRVHIDSAVVEPNDSAAQPYKGTVKSSWHANGRRFEPRGRDS